MNPPSHLIFTVLMVVLTAISVVGLISPHVLARHLGGPRHYRAPKAELFMRIAAALVLIGAAIELVKYLWRI